MADSLVSPSRTITIGDKQYVLDGSFATLRSLHDRYKNLLRLPTQILDMDFIDLGEVIAIGIGKPDQADVIGELINNKVGATNDFIVLTIEVNQWISLIMCPEGAREKKARFRQSF